MSVRSFRSSEVPALHARFSTAALLWSSGRLHAVENLGVTSEDALALRAFPRLGRLARPVVTVVLDGVARISIEDRHHWLGVGDALVMPQKAPVVMRQEGARFASLVLECEPACLAEAPRQVSAHRLTAAGLDAAGALARALREARTTRDDLERWSGVLRTLGLRATDLAAAADEATDPQHQRLCDVLDRLLSELAAESLKHVLESRMRLSVRQFQRVVSEFHQCYGFNAEGWIDARNRRRLLLGAGFMTAPGATATRVAPAVGFTSAAAFSRALCNAGLPRPGVIASTVAALREGDVRK